MTRRRHPLTTVGAVALYAPTPAHSYYRLTWTDPTTGRRAHASAGTDLSAAMQRATNQDQLLREARTAAAPRTAPSAT